MATSNIQRKKDVGQFAAKVQGEPDLELSHANGADHDMTWWNDDERAFPASLYAAGVDGILEPYNGDYPVKDGALRYWREDMARELLIGELEDGTTVVAVEADIDEGIHISEDLGSNPAPDRIRDAIRTVREKAADLAPVADD